jgi:hypothetical protein
VGRRGSGPAFGQVRLELCHVLIFSFFFIKEKGQKEKTIKVPKEMKYKFFNVFPFNNF